MPKPFYTYMYIQQTNALNTMPIGFMKNNQLFMRGVLYEPMSYSAYKYIVYVYPAFFLMIWL